MANDKPDTRRPSHNALMTAQHALGDARDQESTAGNLAVSRYLNDLCLSVFAVAIGEGIDARLAESYAAVDEAAGR